ncbi:MAG: helix-hairpin-helix domain-containing protein [Oscillospiraceae bacterium]|nr:helix-hairpin-helix domain-containing protein [Oscillospiraceae bacterium]
MKLKRFELLLLLFAAAAVLFTVGFLTGRLTARTRVYVTASSAAPAERSALPDASAASDPIDLNAADETTLMTLPGVGPELASAIVAYRTEHGGFRAVSELMNIRGIGETVYRALLPLVTAGASVSPGQTDHP